MTEYCTQQNELPDAIRGYVVDALSEAETFRAAVKTTTGGLTQTVWLAVTSDNLFVVVSKLIDATLVSVPLTTVTSIEVDRVDLPGERRREISLETVDDSFTYELHDPDGEFTDTVQTAVAGVPDPELTDPTHPTDIDHAIQNCEDVVEAAASARSEGSLDEASDQYETAITGYRTVLERLSTGDDRRDAIEEALTDIQAARQQLSELQERRETVKTRLTAAENSFQTAVRAHANGEQTVAKIRYRQARDGFEDALELIDGDLSVFAKPIRISPDADTLAVSGPLAEFSRLSTASIEALFDDEIATVADLQGRAAGPTAVDTAGSEPTPTVGDLSESAAIDRADVPVLLALSWQRTEPISFAARSDVEHRLDQATSGYDETV
ncbi:hypothetical protein ABNG02_06615 [Halorubrum ejinorense]